MEDVKARMMKEGAINLENEYSDTFRNVAMLYNGLLSFISMNLGYTFTDSTRLVQIISEKYLRESPMVCAGGGKPAEVQMDLMLGKVGRIMMVSYKQLNAELEANTMLEHENRTLLGKRTDGPVSVSNLGTNYPSTNNTYNQQKGSLRNSYTEKLDIEHGEAIESFKRYLALNSEQSFIEKYGKQNDDYVEVQDKKDIPLVKLYTVSCGIHDRYSATSIFNPADFNSGQKLPKLCKVFCGDITPKDSYKITTVELDIVNELVASIRPLNLAKKLGKLGCKGCGRGAAAYEVSETRCYLRGQRNGRPDLVLRNGAGRIVGIVEVKKIGNKVSEGNHTVNLKQLSHYCHLFQALEGYLVYIPYRTYSGKPRIFEQDSTYITSTEETMPTMLSNLQLVRDLINELSLNN